MMSGMWTHPGMLAGEVVRLEPLSLDHLDALWAASRDPRTWKWLSIRQPHTRAAFRAWAEEALEGPDFPFVTIVRADADGRSWGNLPVPRDPLHRSVAATGDFIAGSTRFLAQRPEHRSVEIGWTWLTPTVWSTGANVEAKLLMLGRAFDEAGCIRVELKTDARNERSRAAMEALGATFEGVHRQHMLVRGGENRDSAWYSIVDGEWPAVRERLLVRLGRS
jgi:RimJ/RimL family protein N-acetyltransferase